MRTSWLHLTFLEEDSTQLARREELEESEGGGRVLGAMMRGEREEEECQS